MQAERERREIRRPAEIASEIAAALMWGPKSRNQVCEIVAPGYSQPTQLQKYFDEFERSGCCRVCGFTERGRPIYEWNATPFAKPSVRREGSR